MPTQKLLERKALIVGIVINVLQVLAGMALVAHGANHRALPQWHVRTGTYLRDLQGHFHHVVVGVFAD